MTHDELLAKIDKITGLLEEHAWITGLSTHKALRAVVELHKPNQIQEAIWCTQCSKRFENSGYYEVYPCPTIQAITEQLG